MEFVRALIIGSLITTAGCNEVDPVKESAEVSKKITEANHAIHENSRTTKYPNAQETKNMGGPYPADEYTLKPNGAFYFLALYPDGKDTIWITIKAKSENDILKKYPKLQAYKVKPDWITLNDWLDIRKKCLEQNVIFDLRDEPKGWLLDHQTKLK